MNLKYLYIVLFINILLFISCDRTVKVPDSSKLPETEEKSYQAFVIQPFSDVPEIIIDSLYKNLKRINPNIKVNEAIPLPEKTYYSPRNRYRADSLIQFLWYKSRNNSVIIGVTSKDISTTKGENKDWGIMGLAYCPGISCVVSSHRLSKNNLNEQLYKLTIHELGHTQGLPHCKNLKCYMQDAEGKNKKDDLIYFCNSCKLHLQERGWMLE